jgi:hypothetical protein
MTDSPEAAVSAHTYAVRSRKPQFREPHTPKISELEPSQGYGRRKQANRRDQVVTAEPR